jgi:hypothetical protein
MDRSTPEALGPAFVCLVPNPVIRAKATAAFIRLKDRCESRRSAAMSTGTLAGA